MKLTIVGTGYVGLVTGTCLADVGVDVTCVDIDEKKIQRLRNGEVPIYEPGLDLILKNNVEKGRLHFSTSLKDVLKGVEVVMIAVGTPQGEDGSADLQYVSAVAGEIGRYMEDYHVVVTKSTVPVGTHKVVRNAIQQELDARGVDLTFDVVSNPEFLKEGAAVADFLKPDRIVIGTESEMAKEIMHKLYRPFLLNGHPIIDMDPASSEMTKYAANAMLATRISFMNDVANLCERMGADVNKVRKGIGVDPRIGSQFIYAGIGYGGSCFPKDVKALLRMGQEMDYPMEVLEAVDRVNNRQKSLLVEKVMKHFGRDLSGLKFAVWGLSFKPKTDDMREAPSLRIIDQLIAAGATVCAYDPVAMEVAAPMLPASTLLTGTAEAAVQNADALLLLTEWPEFRMPDFTALKAQMAQPVIFDGRNIYAADDMRKLGYTYYGIGLGE
ncbi:MAG: UDP-glucose 6-dehydrogenase [Sphingobacteriales bacterium BACL12 MAG-120802-bin5]|jgi:UDPglucose 6-dehydrogenase|nr:MAG: UDP-glucose 6-dehydrogenase [Sphingobacteriales bacterium BACL12 MAG-120802-bin5]